MMFPFGIKFKVTLWYLLILAVTLGLVSVVTYYALARSLDNIVQGDSRLTVIRPKNIINVATGDATNEQPFPISSYVISEEWLANLQSQSSSSISIHAPQGQVVIDQKDFITPEMQGEQRVRVFLRRSENNPGSYEVLVITLPVSEAKSTLEAFKTFLYVVMPVTSVLAGGVGFLLIWVMLKPVKAMTRTAHQIGETDLGRRIEVRSEDELGQLALTLNQTFERLQKAFESEYQFTADASHQLRTPLAIMRGEATLALNKERSNEEYRKSLELISRETTHMSSIINKLLVLASVDSGKDNLSLGPVNLRDLLSDLATDVEALCEDKSLHFELDMRENLLVEGDEVKLRELFLNLLDNAIRYTLPGGSLTLSLTRRKNKACIAIKDTGIGIPQEHLPLIFKRFYRVDTSRLYNEGGAGLGLAICQGIAELHGGQITVESQVGVGSTFSVNLPLSKK